LKRQHDKLTTKIKITLDLVTPETQDDAKATLAELSRQRREIDAKMREIKESEQVPAIDVEATVDSLVERIGHLGEQLGTLPAYPLRQVLDAFIKDMTADMVTREVEITLRVPQSAIIDAKTPLNGRLAGFGNDSMRVRTGKPEAVFQMHACEEGGMRL
jgi:hypothetical protein